MSERSQKFSKELDKLIQEGEILLMSIIYDCMSEENQKNFIQKQNVMEKPLSDHTVLSNFFKGSYQSWYSKAQAVVKQVLPDRLADFVSYYEYPRSRKNVTHENYMIRDYLQCLSYTRGYNSDISGPASAIPEFQQQLNIVKAAKDALDSTLMDLRAILQADLFDTEIETAGALAKAGYLRAAGAICGVVIEKHLRYVCETHNITIKKKNPGINDLAQHLRSSNVITLPNERIIQSLADTRNICSHAKDREPNQSEINELVEGTGKILKIIN